MYCVEATEEYPTYKKAVRLCRASAKLKIYCSIGFKDYVERLLTVHSKLLQKNGRSLFTWKSFLNDVNRSMKQPCHAQQQQQQQQQQLQMSSLPTVFYIRIFLQENYQV
jgi:pyruvate/oxaloacetate carboxyltransferase